MILKEGQKWACRSCITGHRSSKCVHQDRELFPIAKKGRPSNQCKSCQERRAADLPPDTATCTCPSKFRRPSKTPVAGGSTAGMSLGIGSRPAPMQLEPDAKRRRQSDGPGPSTAPLYNGTIGDPRYADLQHYQHRAYSSPSSATSSRASSPSSSAFSSISSASVPYNAVQAAYPMPPPGMYGYPDQQHHLSQGGLGQLPPLIPQSPRHYEAWQAYNQNPDYSRPLPMPNQQSFQPDNADANALYKAMGVQQYPDFNYLLTTHNGAAAVTPRASDSQQQPAWPGSLPLPSTLITAPSFVRDDHYPYPVPGMANAPQMPPAPGQSSQLVQNNSQPAYNGHHGYSQPIQTSASHPQHRPVQPFVPSSAYYSGRHSDPAVRYRPEAQSIRTEQLPVAAPEEELDATTPTLNSKATWSQENLSKPEAQREAHNAPPANKWNSAPAAPAWREPMQQQQQQQQQHRQANTASPAAPIAAVPDPSLTRLPLPHYTDANPYSAPTQMNLSIPEDRKRKVSTFQAQA